MALLAHRLARAARQALARLLLVLHLALHRVAIAVMLTLLE